ncbi:MAG: alpha-mannosidase [Clostridia bacterium]|nr:alpha-mannosidase [Clostridia bacterium]
MTLYDKIASLGGIRGQSPATARIVSEIGFAAELSTAKGHIYDEIVDKAAQHILDCRARDGVVTNTACNEAEQMLMPLSADAKAFTVHCISHAHIDMNWMWGYQETAAVTVDTFRTVLDLMKEYPDFTFAQSQASTYEIIEQYAPEMIDEIKKYVKEGRWEVSASTWVETDKNMPNGESLARHILYTKRYLSKLLELDPATLELDFEPDTFGHNVSIPEICTKGGVKYYYHCRGNNDASNLSAYRWRARNGAELMVWRDPNWYNGTVDENSFHKVPQLCTQNGIDQFLFVYGVGDHGGGPTRRDIDRIITISGWPIMPTVKFSTYSNFFHALESSRDVLPIREGEMNFVFTGCYTSQSRIKMANRIGEDRIYESEMLGAAANQLGGGPRYNKSFGKAWEQILFNHFHDILPGSGVIDTREYALGQFQRAMAAIQTNANCAMRTMAEAIDTSALMADVKGDSTSQGAGVGYMVGQAAHYGMPRTERGLGKKRVFHLFNTTQYDYEGVCDLTVWDWQYDAGRALFADAQGNETAYKITANGAHYWGHTFKQFALMVKVPAMGYATYTLDEKSIPSNEMNRSWDDRYDGYNDEDLIMENNLIKAVFDHRTMQLISLVDKKTGEDLVALPACSYRLIKENTIHGMSSWRVGNYMTVENLNETQKVRVHDINLGGIRKWIRYDLSFGERSKLSVSVYLNDNSNMLDFDTTIDFHEVGSHATYIPQVNFILPVGYATEKYRYDIPFATLDRPAIEHDVPANSFAAAIPNDGEDKTALMLISDTKYGFRGAENAISLDLVRGSYDPDPYPEYGVHNIRVGVGVVDGVANDTLFRAAAPFVHPIAACSARAGKGTLPLGGSLLTVDGDVHISAVKTPEDFDGLMIRLSDGSGKGADYSLTFAKTPTAACEADINENVLGELPVSGNTVKASVAPYAVQTILVKF